MKKILLLFFPFLMIASLAEGQTTISGTVTDQHGETLVGANVLIRNSYDGTSSGIDGQYRFTTDQVGVVEIVVSFIGYSESTRKITLVPGTITIDITLHEAINKMDAVVITAGTFDAGTGTKSEVLRPLDIVTTAGATADIAGALNSLPGTQTVGEEGRLFIRGGDGSETKTFIDGLQVLKPYTTTIPNTPTRGRFSPFMFKGTSFSTGGYSAEYGQALSSALILNTKERQGQNRTDLSLMSVGTELSHTQSWASSSLAVQGAYHNLKPYFGLVPQTNDWVDPPESAQGNMAFLKELGSSGMWKAYGNIYTSRFSFFKHDILDPSILTKIEVTNHYAYGNSSLKNVIGDKWTYRTGMAYTTNTDKIVMDGELIQVMTKGGHVKATFTGNLANWMTLHTGGELLYSESDQDYQRTSDGFTFNTNFRDPIWSGFVETDIYLSNSFLARVGGRAEYTNLNKNVYLAPRLSLAYKTGDNAQISLAAGSFQQAPADDLLRVANRLDFEKADHFILNYQWISSNRTFRIEGYLKRYRDLVKFISEDKNNPMVYTNKGNGYAKGIDIFWRDSKTLKNVDYWVSYSYLDTRRDYRDFPERATPTFASSHNLSVVYKQWLPSFKTQVGGTFSFTSPRAYNNPNHIKFNGEKTPAYLDLSLNISYLAVQNVIIYGSVTNLLGRENIFGYTFSETPNDKGTYVGEANTLPAPRFLFLGVFITFSKDSTLNQLKSL